MTSRNTSRALQVAALGVQLSDGAAPKAFRLIPLGTFRATDGRPAGVAGWQLDRATAQSLADRVNARATPLVIDYEHQTLLARENGKPAPAAGWINALDVRDDGLYASDVQWTADAATLIESKQYRFISPVFGWDKRDGSVRSLGPAALTNNPGLDGLTDLAACAASLFTQEETPQMKALLAALGLAESATEQDALSALDALKTGHVTELATLTAEVTTLKSAAPDPAKYVELATLTGVQAELATAKSEIKTLRDAESKTKVDALVAEGMASGKLTPATEAWARELGQKDIAALTGYLDKAQPVIVPGDMQSGGKGKTGLDKTDAVAISKAALTYQAECAQRGEVITTLAAIEYVTKE